jgi:membrane protein CcdC involved in cytochrome C biogenesis
MDSLLDRILVVAMSIFACVVIYRAGQQRGVTANKVYLLGVVMGLIGAMLVVEYFLYLGHRTIFETILLGLVPIGAGGWLIRRSQYLKNLELGKVNFSKNKKKG